MITISNNAFVATWALIFSPNKIAPLFPDKDNKDENKEDKDEDKDKDEDNINDE